MLFPVLPILSALNASGPAAFRAAGEAIPGVTAEGTEDLPVDEFA
jgi:hypothetical protein